MSINRSMQTATLGCGPIPNSDDEEDLKLVEQIIRHHLLQPVEEPVSAAVAEDKQVIVKVGAEGGSLTLYGIQSPDGWQFRVETNEAALVDDDDDDDDMLDLPKRPWVTAWRSALKQLDSYPWTRLYPLKVHPDFRDRVFKALQTRHKKEPVINWNRWNPVLKNHAK